MNSRHSEWLDSIPPDWNCITLDQIGEVISGSTPSRAIPKYWDGEYPWVTPGELSNLKTSHLTETRDYLTRTGLLACSSGLLASETLLITTRATIGAKVLAGVPVSTNQGFKSIVFKSSENPNFYFHLFDLMPGELKRLASGTTFLEISGHEFKKIRVPHPCPLEQRRIAEILDTVDDAIRRTDQVIEKLQQMKQGLLHDLLTRGIDENGELRPPPEEAPHLYKDSPLGLIPKMWGVISLRDALSVKLGFAFHSEDYADEGLLNFRVSNIGRPVHDFGERRFLPTRFWNQFPGQQLHGGEIVVVMVGATVGKLGRVPFDVCPALQNQNMWNLVPNESIYREFLWLVLPDAIRRHLSLSQGSARDFLTQKDFLRTLIVVPSYSEQRSFSTKAVVLDTQLNAEETYLEKVLTLKKGLMDDLLTGKVRVNVPEGEC